MKTIFVFIILILIISCDAPRNNPLDPYNKDNIYHFLEGHVKTQDISREPLTDVIINWPDQHKIAQTNLLGFFSIELVGAHDGWLYFDKENYWSDSLQIIWGETSKKSVEILLNSVASIESLRVFSSIQHRHFSYPKQSITVEVTIKDREKDIDSVHVNVPLKQIRTMLNYNAQSKKYIKSFSMYQLEIINAVELVGQTFQIEIKEDSRESNIIGSGILKRVILDTVKYISPSQSEITSSTPRLKWKEFNLDFEFNFMLEIYTKETFPQLVWRKEEINSDSTSYMVDSPLSVDEYQWVIWAIDKFGNRSGSIPASFEVQ